VFFEFSKNLRLNQIKISETLFKTGNEINETLVQHTWCTCAYGKTLEAVLVVDSWDSSAVSDWGSNLRKIQSEIHLEVYLISGGWSE
jgi:hypothetical protein